MSDWDFGGAYANTQAKFVDIAGAEQAQEQARQMFPTRLAHEQATTRLNNSTAGLNENKLLAEQNLAKISQGLKLGEEGVPQSTNIMKMAGAAMQAGDPTLAQTLTLRAAQVHTQEARETEYAAQTKRQQAEVAIKKADRYAKLMGAVRSEQDFAAANMIWESEFGEPAPRAQYDPRTVEILRQSSIKEADRLRAAHDEEMERLRLLSINNVNNYRGQVLRLRQKEYERRVERDQRATKNDGKDVGAPTQAEVAAATALLSREGKTKGLDPDAAKTATYDLAARARALRKQNPGLDAGEAMQRAMLEQTQEGYYGTKQATSLFGLSTTTVPTYGKPGGSPDRALPVPADRSMIKPNHYYATPKGKLLYLGNGKWQAPAAATAPVSAGFGGPEEDDDEEE